MDSNAVYYIPGVDPDGQPGEAGMGCSVTQPVHPEVPAFVRVSADASPVAVASQLIELATEVRRRNWNAEDVEIVVLKEDCDSRRLAVWLEWIASELSRKGATI